MSSWLGPTIVRPLFYRNILPPAPVPTVFSPTDLSDCVLWLDANDSSTLDINQDTSGVNVNRVMKWFDKAQPSNQNYYTHVGDPAGSGLYNTHLMNGLNTVYFEPGAGMDHQGGGIEFPFQDRTFFAVLKPLTDISGGKYLPIYAGFDVSGAMATVIGYDDISGVYSFVMGPYDLTNSILYEIAEANFDGGSIKNNRMLLGFAQSSTDLSGNAGMYDTLYKPLTLDTLATEYETGQTQYTLGELNGTSAQDVAEIIMYSRVLSHSEQIQVLDYLADKWNLSGPS